MNRSKTAKGRNKLAAEAEDITAQLNQQAAQNSKLKAEMVKILHSKPAAMKWSLKREWKKIVSKDYKQLVQDVAVVNQPSISSLLV